ncbi:MAG: serine/threonine protein kinase, partial [Planctomycetota bacterium]
MSNPNDGPPKDQKLLFGNIAISQGFVTHAQIDECKRYQDQQRAQGAQPDRIGDLLVNRGYLTPAQVKEIFRIQGREGGHTQISGYELIEQIGKGAMGVVYRARQVSMERIVAIKILYPKLARNTSFVDRFISEARASARLNHPNIITGIDVGESNGIYYYAMEYVDGRTVQDILKRGGS